MKMMSRTMISFRGKGGDVDQFERSGQSIHIKLPDFIVRK